MDISPQIYVARVMHKRCFPKENSFNYSIYYLALPLSQMDATGEVLALNRAGAMSFHYKDHGAKDGSALAEWIMPHLASYGLDKVIDNIVLVTMPRILGYVFNPVSFWLCLDKAGNIRAVWNEVNNTFGETHSYLCAHPDHRPIQADDWLRAEKLFHVSPFLKREGHYAFRYTLADGKLGIWIDYYDANGEKELLTALTGRLIPMTRRNLRHTFWQHPLVTFKAILLIHWQAIKLAVKRVRYINKPQQKNQKTSHSENLTKM